MAKIIGFNQDVSDKAIEEKKDNQRKASMKFAGRNVHFIKGYKMPNPVLKERIVVGGGVCK